MTPRMVSSPLVSGDEWTDCYDHMKNSLIEDSDDEPLFPDDEEEEDDEVDGFEERHLSRCRTRTNSSSGLSSTSSSSSSNSPTPATPPPMTMQTQEVVDVTCGSRPRKTRRKRKSGHRRRIGSRSGRGAVATTLFGPAGGVLMGGRQEWSKMKKYIRRLASAQDPRNKSAIHNSELV